jgi:hypothetical protein
MYTLQAYSNTALVYTSLVENALSIPTFLDLCKKYLYPSTDSTFSSSYTHVTLLNSSGHVMMTGIFSHEMIESIKTQLNASYTYQARPPQTI